MSLSPSIASCAGPHRRRSTSSSQSAADETASPTSPTTTTTTSSSFAEPQNNSSDHEDDQHSLATKSLDAKGARQHLDQRQDAPTGISASDNDEHARPQQEGRAGIEGGEGNGASSEEFQEAEQGEQLSAVVRDVLETYQRIAEDKSLPKGKKQEQKRLGYLEWLGLATADFAQLEHVLHDDPAAADNSRWASVIRWFPDRARQEYDPDRGRLRLRMPAPIHDLFVRAVIPAITEGLKRQLDAHSNSQIKLLASKIAVAGSQTLRLEGGHQLSPDDSLSIGDPVTSFPSITFECVFSHGITDEDAFDRIYKSHGHIRTVLVFIIEYRDPKQRLALSDEGYSLHISLFHLEEDGVDQESHKPEMVARKALNHVPVERGDGKALALTFSDFNDTLGQLDPAGTVSISHERLLDILADAAVRQNLHDREIAGENKVTTPERFILKRPREADTENEGREASGRKMQRRLPSSSNTTAVPGRPIAEPQRRRSARIGKKSS